MAKNEPKAGQEQAKKGTPGESDPKATAGAGAAGASGAPPTGETGAPAQSAAAAAAAKASALAGLAGKMASGLAKAGFGTAGKVGGAVLGSLKRLLGFVFGLPLLLFRGTLASRLVTLGFVAGIALILVTGTKLIQRFVPEIEIKSVEENAGGGQFNDYLEQQKQYAIATDSIAFLEKFTATVASRSGKVRQLELELYVECDSPDTCRFIKGRLTQVREVVSAAMQGKSYEELMKPEGSESFKNGLREAINRGLKRWEIDGSIRRIFFTHFVMA